MYSRGSSMVRESLLMYVKSLNLPPCTNALNKGNYVESAMEGTNVLQEEGDKRISLGMPMNPQEEESDEEKQEDDENISLGMSMHAKEKEIDNEEKGEQEKEEWGPPKYDSISQTQNSLVFYGTCYYDESDDDMPIIDFMVPNNDFDDNDEYVLDMPYDNALDDGPILLDNPPCLEIATSLCEDKNDKPASCDDTLIYESPILFQSSPIYIIDEKYALCKKYMHGLKLSYGNPTFNHYVNDDINSCQYFERGKHAYDCHNKPNDPLYVPINSMLHSSNGHILEFASHACNYYERGGDKCPLYVTSNYILHSHTDNMQCLPIFAVIYSYIRCQCIGRKLNFIVACFMLCIALFHVSV